MDFFAGDVERITGVQRLRLFHWLKEGFLCPSIQVAQGTGDRNVFSIEDIYQIALLKKLMGNGFHGKTASTFLNIPWESIRNRHIAQKSKNLPGLILCVVRRFVDGKKPDASAWTIVPGQGEDVEKRLIDNIINRFNELRYDEAILINLSKVIDEVDNKV